jgi:hypothetical protein
MNAGNFLEGMPLKGRQSVTIQATFDNLNIDCEERLLRRFLAGTLQSLTERMSLDFICVCYMSICLL